MASDSSKVSKIQTNFQALSSIAGSLNAASDELTRTVGILDESLKRLNIGLSVWVQFSSVSFEDEPEQYDEGQIGYCKVKGTWGIALRRIWGHQAFDRYNEDGPWLFNDAPRAMRLQSVDKIPRIIEELAKEAVDTTKRIEAKTKEVRDLAEAVGLVADKDKVKSIAQRIAAEKIGKEALRWMDETPAAQEGRK
jgi:hypothetical protein